MVVKEVVDIPTLEKAIVSGLVALGSGFAIHKLTKIDAVPLAIGVVAGVTYLITEADVNQLSLKDAVTVAFIVAFTSWLADYIQKNWKTG